MVESLMADPQHSHADYTDDELALASRYAIEFIRPYYTQLPNRAHSIANIESILLGLPKLIRLKGPDILHKSLAEKLQRAELGGADAPMARIVAIGMQQLARHLDIPIDTGALDVIRARTRRLERRERARHAREMELETDLRDLLPYLPEPASAAEPDPRSERRHATMPYSVGAYARLLEAQMPMQDAAQQTAFYQQALAEIGRQIRTTYRHDVHNAVLFFDETVDAVLEDHTHNWVTHGEPSVRNYLEQFRAYVKRELFVRSPERVRNALAEAVREIVPPLVNGQQQLDHAPTPYPDTLERIARRINERAQNYKARYDVAAYFTHWSEYGASQSGVRMVLNQIICRALEKLDLPVTFDQSLAHARPDRGAHWQAILGHEDRDMRRVLRSSPDWQAAVQGTNTSVQR